MAVTIAIADERCIDHVTRHGHPESPDRLVAIYEMLEEPDVRGCVERLAPKPATREQLASNHSPAYIERIESTAGRDFISLDPDTSTSAGSWEAALLAAGGVVHGIDEIMSGRARNGFALVRPPGHHAEHDRAMGFCLFNNVAIGAHHLRQAHGVERVLIVDWDIHHGNGTQNAFYGTPGVLYVSTHQYPYYPGSGGLAETGKEEGLGYTINIPLPGGQGDSDFCAIFREIITPVAAAYRPEFILVSAGYDIYCHDPLGTMDVTPQGFGAMTKILRALARTHCSGRLLLTLEGGYNIQGQRDSVRETLLALAGADAADGADDSGAGHQPAFLDQIKRAHARHWECLR